MATQTYDPSQDPVARAIAARAKGAAVYNPIPYNPSMGAPIGGQLADIQPSPLVDIRGVVPGTPTPQPGSKEAVDAGAPASTTTLSPDTLARYGLGPTPQPTPKSNLPQVHDLDERAIMGGPVGRALVAFAHGVQATPSGASASPLGGAVAGGLAGAGQSYQDLLSRRLALYQMQNAPALEARKALLKTAAEKQAADPYEAAAQARMLDRQTQDIRLKAQLNRDLMDRATAGLKPADALALNKQAEQDVFLQGIDPSSDQFQDAVARRVQALAAQARGLGSTVVRPQPVPPRAPAASGQRPPLSSFITTPSTSQ